MRHLTVKSLKLGGISWPLVPLVHVAYKNGDGNTNLCICGVSGCRQPWSGSLYHTPAAWSHLWTWQGGLVTPHAVCAPRNNKLSLICSLPTATQRMMPGKLLQLPASTFAPSLSIWLQTWRKTQRVSTEGEGKETAKEAALHVYNLEINREATGFA